MNPRGLQVRFDNLGRGVRAMRAGDERGAPQVVCFPYAGGSATAFRNFAIHAPKSWDLIAIDPPGHGFNRGPLLTTLEEMVDTYCEVVAPILRAPYYLLGHSLGGMVVYLLGARLERGPVSPAGIVISASKGPRKLVDENWSGFDDDTLIAKLDSIGGVPDVFKNMKEDFKAFLPAIRADLRALEIYQHKELDPLSTPMTIMSAREDSFVPASRAREWLARGRHATLVELPGGHFSLESHPADYVRAVERAVTGGTRPF